ncbi:hypothetical protein CXF72_04040 [Psychromonas sp. MB-3u-54]|uniref:hypothetical protein n=1 Tax=Psychromonas sp. MB-3u-54 TaxID=2058319 RepID=UPI000C32B488|nr:hypothetical protein [Psychromonas sp. MB-3u-54]PKH03845.1 hypothetical protein CXF72_04040 [Psychromonas sp. MB-3u-54]
MKIDKMPKKLEELVDKFGLNVPNVCYMNCFCLVMQTLAKKYVDIYYVLATATDAQGKDHPHAVVSYNNKFYDPTLEPQGLVSSTAYTFIKQFSTDEIAQLMVKKFPKETIENMCNGLEPFWPLQQLGENKFDFVNDGSPTLWLSANDKPTLVSRIMSMLGFYK